MPKELPNSAATARAVRSFFADLDARPSAIRVCAGLSCTLNGGPALGARVAEDHDVRPAYCLGLCDRSPALLTPEGRAWCGDAARAWPDLAPPVAPDRVDIRAVSSRAIVTERIASGSHASLAAARAAGAYEALRFALSKDPGWLLAMIEASGEQGRGGAGYPTGQKWRLCASAKGDIRHVVANGDEGDPGSFVDRVLLEDDPHTVLEGLALCAYAVGAREGIVFIRSEYPQAQWRMSQAITEARESGLLGSAVFGSRFAFDVRVAGGNGSYVCGEETALLNAIEGHRGEARVRPPYPTASGLYGAPTVVNNIETLVNIPWIVRQGADAYRRLGTPGSPGTKAMCLNRGFRRPGIVEVEFGCGLDQIIQELGGGAPEGQRLTAVVIGGPMGSVLAPADWHLPLDYPVLRDHGVRLGHGGLVAITDATDPWDVLLNGLEFMAAESCGKCAPCALGSRQALALGRRLRASPDEATVGTLVDLLSAVEVSSLCGFGRGIPRPLKDLIALALETMPGRRAAQ